MFLEDLVVYICKVIVFHLHEHLDLEFNFPSMLVFLVKKNLVEEVISTIV
jgi:hypothetical protein